jgi:hypothetical protein
MNSSNIIDKINPSMWAPLYNWSFISCCFCLAILILTLKRATSQISPSFYGKSSTHGWFTLSYLLGGVLAAVPKTYLVGAKYFDRVIVGIIASGLSLAVYHAIIKRLSSAIGVPDKYLEDPDDKTPAPKVETEITVSQTVTPQPKP